MAPESRYLVITKLFQIEITSDDVSSLSAQKFHRNPSKSFFEKKTSGQKNKQ